MRISCHFERSAAESRNLVLSTLLKTGLTDLRYNPAFGRDDNGASFNHNWYKWSIKKATELSLRGSPDLSGRLRQSDFVTLPVLRSPDVFYQGEGGSFRSLRFHSGQAKWHGFYRAI